MHFLADIEIFGSQNLLSFESKRYRMLISIRDTCCVVSADQFTSSCNLNIYSMCIFIENNVFSSNAREKIKKVFAYVYLHVSIRNFGKIHIIRYSYN